MHTSISTWQKASQNMTIMSWHDITVPVDFDVTGKESVCVADTYVVTVDFDVTATRVSGKLLCHSGLW